MKKWQHRGEKPLFKKPLLPQSLGLQSAWEEDSVSFLWGLPWFSGAATAKPQARWLKPQTFIFSQFGGQKSKNEVSAGLISPGVPLLGLKVAVFSFFLYIVFLLYVSVLNLLSLSLFLIRTLVIELGPTPMTSFDLNYLFKDLLSKCSHILRYCEVGLQHLNIGEDTISP